MQAWVAENRPGHVLQILQVDSNSPNLVMTVYKQIRPSDHRPVGILIDPALHSVHEQTSLRNLADSGGLPLDVL